jgi:hypothetical protein
MDALNDLYSFRAYLALVPAKDGRSMDDPIFPPTTLGDPAIHGDVLAAHTQSAWDGQPSAASRAVSPAFERLAIVATMGQDVDGASQTRFANPLRALAAEPGVSVQIISDNVFPDLPPGTAGICILHRPVLVGETGLGVIRNLLAKGYLIVSEFDVSPDAAALRATDVFAVRGAVSPVVVYDCCG